eukprot:s1090_g12.t1
MDLGTEIHVQHFDLELLSCTLFGASCRNNFLIHQLAQIRAFIGQTNSLGIADSEILLAQAAPDDHSMPQLRRWLPRFALGFAAIETSRPFRHGFFFEAVEIQYTSLGFRLVGSLLMSIRVAKIIDVARDWRIRRFF